MRRDGCPSADLLRNYARGEVSEAELEAVSAHVRSCPDCLAEVEALNDTTDPLIAALRGPRPPEPAQDEVPFQKAIARLLATESRGPAGDPVPTDVPPAVGPGTVLREYRLLGKLGEGGMGAVYRALHTRLDKVVALKVLPPGRPHDRESVARFEREMKAAGRFRHPHIVQATDAGEHDGVPFLVMEYVEGTDLAELVRRRGLLPAAEACELVLQAARGLHHAHENGLVHRDVKPSNLLLTPEGEVKVSDLGLALLRGGSDAGRAPGDEAGTEAGGESLTSASRVVGTRDYMAPEQWRDAHAVDARADVYGLGCTLWFLLTGRPPSRPTPAALPRLRDVRPDAPDGLEPLLRSMLAEHPGGRPPSAQAVAEALAPFAALRSGSPVAAPPAVIPPDEAPTLSKVRRPPPRSGPGLVLLAVLALGGGGLAVALWPKGRAVTPDPKPSAPEQGGIVSPPEPEHLPPPAEWPELLPGPPPHGEMPLTFREAADLQRQWAAFKRRPVVERNGIGMELALIPPGELSVTPGPGSFVIGHPFDIGVHEVTFRQFHQFVTETGYRTEAEATGRGGRLAMRREGVRIEMPSPKCVWRSPGFAAPSDDLPVVQATWADATAFCVWLSAKEGRTYRLPSQAEWRWACQAGSARPDDGFPVRELAYYDWDRVVNPRQQPQPVGKLRPNPWKLHDMLGNVEEWALDFHNPRLPVTSRLIDRPAPTGLTNANVLGGSYWSLDVGYFTSISVRPKNTASSTIGFRVVREP